MRRTIFIAILCVFGLAADVSVSRADSPRLVGHAIEFGLRAPGGKDGSASLDRLLTEIVLEHIPHSYENKKDWGHKSERWDGLHISLDGLRLDTKRRKKEVNHGTWNMYRIRFIEPDEELRVRLDNARLHKDGTVGFDIYVTAPLRAFGRTSKWVKGVQLYSFSANADARARLKLSCRVGVIMDITKLPPDIVFEPKVTDADLELLEFRVTRISAVGGKVAEELGRSIRRVLEREIEKKRHKLVDKLNRQIKKNKDDLRLSMHDAAVNKWNGWAEVLRQQQSTDERRSDGESP